MNTGDGHLSKSEPEVSESNRSAVREAIRSGATLSAPYVAMNVAAALIAGFGLLENSPATIIGAMLIAMLYGPIVGIGLGLAEADLPLLGRSLFAEIVGGAFVLASGFLIGMASRDLVIGNEILGRTSPSMVDLLVALVGGLAGGYTFVSTGLSGVVVGVAIATSLVPPLATCGILLARPFTGAGWRCFSTVSGEFCGDRPGRDAHILACRSSPPGCRPSKKSAFAEIDLFHFGSAARFSPERHPSARKRTVNSAT